MKKQYILYTFIFSIISFSMSAQKETNKSLIWSSLKGFEYQIKAGLSIGGTSPIPIPVEIRSIDKYSPTLGMSIEGSVTKWFDPNRKWGLESGLRLENKGMLTQSTVKNYSMKIIGDGGEEISGVWTGGVETNVHLSYLSVPLLANYKLSSRWNLKAGLYFSYLLNGNFSGNVYDGYLRRGDPTGSKIEFSNGQTASYDFSNNLSRFQWGTQLGAEWRAFNKFSVGADLNWGFNSIFPKDFDTVTYKLYPIYLNIGFGYHF